MSGSGPHSTTAHVWGPYFAKPATLTKQQEQKGLRKEVIGFLILGPASAALMIYDLIFGLEHHEPHPIAPYPWMRIRRLPGMPWGQESLFETESLVAKEWPPAEGLPAKH